MKRNKYKERPLNFISNVTQKNYLLSFKIKSFEAFPVFEKNPQNDKKIKIIELMKKYTEFNFTTKRFNEDFHIKIL